MAEHTTPRTENDAPRSVSLEELKARRSLVLAGLQRPIPGAYEDLARGSLIAAWNRHLGKVAPITVRTDHVYDERPYRPLRKEPPMSECSSQETDATREALAAAHGCDVECEDTGRLLTCRDCAEQSVPPDPSCTCGAVEYGAAQHLVPCPLRVNPSVSEGGPDV